jgi:hypothetical protein
MKKKQPHFSSALIRSIRVIRVSNVLRDPKSLTEK